MRVEPSKAAEKERKKMKERVLASRGYLYNRRSILLARVYLLWERKTPSESLTRYLGTNYKVQTKVIQVFFFWWRNKLNSNTSWAILVFLLTKMMRRCRYDGVYMGPYPLSYRPSGPSPMNKTEQMTKTNKRKREIRS